MKKLFVMLLLLSTLILNGATYTRDIEGFNEKPQLNGIFSFDNFSLSYIPAKPILPVKNEMLLMKPFAKNFSVKIIHADYKTYDMEKIEFALPPVANNVDLKDWRNKKREFEKINAFYPENIVSIKGEGYYRKYRYVKTSVYPMQYNPVTHKLRVYSNIQYEIIYDVPTKYTDYEKSLLNDNIGTEKAKKLFDNWNDFSTYYTPTDKTRSLCDLLILTTPSLKSFPLIDSFIQWKQSIGVSCKVVTIDSIIANVSGTDTQEKIRNFLISTYPTSQWGYKWLLIIGDLDSIPMRKLFPDSTNHATSGSNDDYNPPSDFYYAELTGNFDADGDGYYGEYGQDSTEFVPEIAVGRIPYDYTPQVSQTLTGIMNFESNTDISYKQNFIYMGAISNYANEDSSGYNRTDGGALGEDLLQNVLMGWNYFRMNELAGIHPSTYTCEAPLTKNNVTNNWNGGQFGLATWWAHGSPTGAYRKYWSSDDGDSVPEASEMAWTTFIDTGSVQNIYNNPSVLFSCSCNNAWPDNGNNLIRSLLQYASISVVGANRVSWYSIGWLTHTNGGNASIDYHFLEGIVSNNYNIGDALNYSYVTYFNNYFWWGWQSAQNIYDFSLYGDPSLFYFGKTVGIKEKPVPTKSDNMLKIKQKYSKEGIVFDISGNTSDKKLYILDVSGRKYYSTKGNYSVNSTKYSVKKSKLGKAGIYFAFIEGVNAKPVKIFVLK